MRQTHCKAVTKENPPKISHGSSNFCYVTTLLYVFYTTRERERDMDRERDKQTDRERATFRSDVKSLFM